MSYILDALRKMEREKRKDSGPESLVDQLTAQADDEKPEAKGGPDRLIIAVSIFFGVTGILMGLLFYIDNPEEEKKGKSQVTEAQVALKRPETAPVKEVAPKEKEPPKQAKAETAVQAVTLSDSRSTAADKADSDKKEKTPGAKVEVPAPAKEKDLTPLKKETRVQAVTLAEVKSSVPGKADIVLQEKPPSPKVEVPAPAKEKDPTPLKREAGEQAVTLAEVKSTVPGKADIVLKEKPPGPKVEIPVPTAPPPQARQERVIDLTDRHRLTSTGSVKDRKYATIDRNDYFIGDEFKGMVITAIEKDRVQLRGKGDGQRYVIIFRYR